MTEQYTLEEHVATYSQSDRQALSLIELDPVIEHAPLYGNYEILHVTVFRD